VSRFNEPHGLPWRLPNPTVGEGLGPDNRAAEAGPKLDPLTPHSARIWNYWLGGKDNFAADREVGDQVAAMLPSITRQAREDRQFLVRAVRFLAAECGVRQFLDIGTGLPTADNTHEVAQRIDPTCRIVYVDNDPVVLTHAHALLTSTPEGRCDYLGVDLREPERILDLAADTLDPNQPIALMLLGVLHHVTDDEHAYAVVQKLTEALPAGSYVAINHATNAVFGQASDQAAAHWNQFGTPKLKLRTPQQIQRFFDGLELLEPGVVTCSQWRAEVRPWGLPDAVDEFAGVGVKR
jgi:O-methyltransferase involved in polyketide biosynthesis